MRRNVLYIAFAALFFVICAVPSVGMLVFRESAPRANQILAPAPEVTKGGRLNPELLPEVDDYVSDHFALRQELITAGSVLKSAVLGSSNTDQVIVGRDGWLFYSSTSDDYLNIPTVTDRQAANAAISLSLMQEYAAARGADFLFAAAPNKNSVYPQYMPSRYVPLNGGGTAEMLFGAMGIEGVDYIDLFSLIDAQDGVMYHRTDSHWTAEGASVVQYAVMEALGRAGTDYASAPYTERAVTGDLFEMLYPTDTDTETERGYEFTYTSLLTDISETDAVRYVTENPEKGGSLLMFRDSFGNALAPFLAQEFGSAVFSRAVPYDLRLLDETGADVLIIELAERNLSTLASRAAVMEAPERAIAVPSDTVSAGLEASCSKSGDLLMISGTISGINDAGTRIYAVISSPDGDEIWEAAPVGVGEGQPFTLYVPYDGIDGEFELYLIVTCGGHECRTESVRLVK